MSSSRCSRRAGRAWRAAARVGLVWALCLCRAGGVAAETGHDAWLRYPAISDPAVRAGDQSLPARLGAVGDSLVCARRVTS